MQILLTRKKQIIWTLLLCLSLIGFPLISHALTVKEVPNPQQQYGGWVTDMANILSEQTEVQLNQMISELEATTGAEIAVVTVPTTSPAPTPKAFTTELFNEWGIGKLGVDNGVLFLTSVGDRRVEIETGYGVEGILPDAKVGNIITTQITPKLREGDWDGGILAGTQALVSVLSGNPAGTGFFGTATIPPAPLVATSILGLGLSLFGYKKAKYLSSKPIPLELKGRSLVRGNFRDNLTREFYSWAYLVALTLSFFLLLISLVIDPSTVLWRGFATFSVGFGLIILLLHLWWFIYQKVKHVGGSLFFWGVCVAILLPGGSSIIDLIKKFILDANYNFNDIFGEFGLVLLVIYSFLSYAVSQILIALLYSEPTFECQRCTKLLARVDDDFLSDRFTPAQKVANELGSTKFEGWHCSQCYPKKLSKFHVRRYILNEYGFRECFNCQEFTMPREEKVLIYPSYSNTGVCLINYQCELCDYREEQQEIIPRLTRSSSSSDSGSSGGGESGGGGSFGGGESGGGGAGGDF